MGFMDARVTCPLCGRTGLRVTADGRYEAHQVPLWTRHCPKSGRKIR